MSNSTTPEISSFSESSTTPIQTTPSSAPSVVTTSSDIPTPITSADPTTLVVVSTPVSNSQTLAPVTITQTSTSQASVLPTSTFPTFTSSSSSSSSSATALPTNVSKKASGGLSSGGKIAVAVVVPVAVVALLVGLLLFLWRRRKQSKAAEEMRRKEVEEYGYNPNAHPTIPNVVGAGGDGHDEMREDGAGGYRGWGAAPLPRKPSTTVSGGNGPVGMAVSDNTGPQGSPTRAPGSEAHSGDPLLNSPNSQHTELETIGALGAGPAAGNNRQDIHRGASNASSSYSAANRSDGSADVPLPGGPNSQNYYNNEYYEVEGDNFNAPRPYANEVPGSSPPVIRDVQARRNTRIENPSVVPQQGNAGIAQNF